MIYVAAVRRIYISSSAIDSIKEILRENSGRKMVSDNFLDLDGVGVEWEIWDRPSENCSDIMYVYKSDMVDSVYEEMGDLFLDENFVLELSSETTDEAIAEDMIEEGDFEVVASSRYVFELSHDDGRWIDGENTGLGVNVTLENYVEDFI